MSRKIREHTGKAIEGAPPGVLQTTNSTHSCSEPFQDKIAPNTGFVSTDSDSMAGGVNSGWPGSHSMYATAGQLR